MKNEEEGCLSFDEWLIKRTAALWIGKRPVPNGKVHQRLEANGKQEGEEGKDNQESTLESGRVYVEWLSRLHALA
jgi:hypothetical protein